MLIILEVRQFVPIRDLFPTDGTSNLNIIIKPLPGIEIDETALMELVSTREP